jgi:uncharacterized membrane protein
MNRRPAMALTGAALLAMSYAALAVLYPRIPQSVPMHWNAAGEVDGVMGKQWLFPGMALPALASLLTLLFTRLDTRRQSHEAHAKTLDFILASIFLLFLTIVWISAIYALGLIADGSTSWILVLTGVAFLAVGNVLPRLRHNGTVGIRFPWTLASETVWRKTHRAGGFLMAAAGVGIIVAAFLAPKARSAVTLVSILGFLVVTAAYSFILYAIEEKEKSR